MPNERKARRAEGRRMFDILNAPDSGLRAFCEADAGSGSGGTAQPYDHEAANRAFKNGLAHDVAALGEVAKLMK